MGGTVILWFNGADGPSMLVVGTLYICGVWSWFLWRWGVSKGEVDVTVDVLLDANFTLGSFPQGRATTSRLQAWTADLAILLLKALNFDVWKRRLYHRLQTLLRHCQ